jgi:hypothetical protein
MVTRTGKTQKREAASLMVELLVAIALLVGVLFPLVYSIASEKRLARSYYQRAVAMELVDGELEVLAAGTWKSFQTGTQDYRVNPVAATNLPPGRFLLTVETNKVRLEWRPSVMDHGGPVVREVSVR